MCGLFSWSEYQIDEMRGHYASFKDDQKAKSLGLKVMVGCMTESTIGCSAIAQLVPQLDFVDMDGCLLVDDTISRGIRINYGKIIYSKIAGTGAELIKRN